MRKMISDEERKVLKNFAVNDNGTIVEIGGNVAFESIEQIGHMVDEPEGIQADLDKIRIFQETYYTSNLVNNVISFTPNSGSWTQFTNEFCPLAESKTVEIYGNFLWYLDTITGPEMGNGFKIAIAEGGSTGSFIVECSNKKAQMQKLAAVGLYSEGGKEFKPFFTEEQYQEILDLIA